MFIYSTDIENYSEIHEGDILFVNDNFPFVFKTKKSLPLIYKVCYQSFGSGGLQLKLLTPRYSFIDADVYHEFESFYSGKIDERIPKITRYDIIGHEGKDCKQEELWPKYKEKVLVEGKFIPKETEIEKRDVPKPLDVTGNELKVGDEVIYTEVDSSRLFRGKIIKFSSTNQRVSINGRWREEIRDCINVYKI